MLSLVLLAFAQAGAHSMTDTISELSRFLSGDVGVAEIAARVGRVLHDEPVPEGLDLRPKLKGVRTARLSRYRTGEPFALDLKLLPANRPTVAAMRQRLGEYVADSVDLEQSLSISFQQPAGAHWKVLVIAVLDSKRGAVRDTDRVVSVAFRRDRVKP